MQGRYEQQMKKGVLEMLVLKQLEKEEKYGYQLDQSAKREKRWDVYSEGGNSLSHFIQA